MINTNTWLWSLVVVLVIGVAVAGYWLWQSQVGSISSDKKSLMNTDSLSPQNQIQARADSTASINKELDDIDLGDLNKDFEAIDADLNSL